MAAGPGRPGRRLFTFAVMADTHVEPEPDPAAPPRSNRRTRAAVERINRLRPAFTVHLGDLVHPEPSLPTAEAADAAVNGILARLDGPLHATPGNHDIGDKPLAWMPAKAVTQAWIDLYARRFQPPFQAFAHGGCRFLLLNAPALNSGCAAEAEQRAWFEAELAHGRSARTFLFTHYPPYLLEPDEESHYDNLDEPARSWLLGLLREHAVEAVFAGHVHNLFHDRFGATEIYVAPSTSFVRRDYSELFRADPASEFGRNDEDKLGFLRVDVHERGHRVSFVRTCGQGGADAAPDPGRSRLGVFLRHPWREVVELPYNPPTDELLRRRVRNDYPAWALWELGIGAVRIPLADLRDPAARARATALAERGHRFTAFSFGAPTAEAARLLREAAGAMATWEVILPPADVAVAAAGAGTGLATRLAPLSTSADSPSGGGGSLSHFVGQGFRLDGRDAIRAVFGRPEVREAFDGCVVRLAWADDPWGGIAAVAELGRSQGIGVTAVVDLSPATPDGDHRDDAALAARVAEASFAALAHGVDVFLDTFMDVDRGYYVRHGLIDRRCNPRQAGRVVRTLHHACRGLPPGTTTLRPEDGTFLAEGASGLCCLFTTAGTALPPSLRRVDPGAAGTADWYDLASGERRRIGWEAMDGPADRQLRLTDSVPIGVPALMVIPPDGRGD